MPKIFGPAACVSLCVTIHAVHEGPKATFEIIQQVYMHIDFLSFITRVSACVLNVCFCWHDNDTTVTLIYDCPAVGEFFTPFPISVRPALCCYRNIDSLLFCTPLGKKVDMNFLLSLCLFVLSEVAAEDVTAFCPGAPAA